MEQAKKVTKSDMKDIPKQMMQSENPLFFWKSPDLSA